MFLKRCSRKKCGKDHVYWQLMESVRTAQGPRQRLVAYLGGLDDAERRGWARLAATLDGKAAAKARQLSLFGPPWDHDDDPVPETIEVKTKGVRVEQARDFGDVFLALTLWRMLGLDGLFEKELPAGREKVPWGLTACILAIARLVEPSSELHVEDTWYLRTVLSDLLGVPVERVTDSRLYRTLDKVLPLKPKIELALKDRIGELFKPEFDILLYDVTSTYFEGEAAKNPKARRGYSRDHRPDCKQVCIGLVVTTDGFPLGYEVFCGNRNDVTTLEEIVEAMEAKYGRANRIWVFDRGIVSESNLEFLRDRGGQYLVGTPKKQLRKFERELLAKDWREVRPGIEVKLAPSPDGEETFVLCRSRQRREKEKAMHERFVSRIKKGLAAIQKGLRRAKKPRDRGKIERRIGRLLGKNSRAAKAFKIELLDDPTRPAGVRLKYRGVRKWRSWAALSEGVLPLAHEPHRQNPGGSLADVHPAHRRGRGLPDREDGAQHPPDLAPAGEEGRGTRPVFVSGICHVEDAADMDGAVRARPRGQDRDRGVRKGQGGRRDPADVGGEGGEAHVRDAARRRTEGAHRPAGS